jgi:hypothetical protein
MEEKGKPGRKPGGVRTGGRQKGTPNKVTAEVKVIAQKHGPAAIARLARIMKGSKNEIAVIAACREILDRAYGKARQPLEVGGFNGAPTVKVTIVKSATRTGVDHADSSVQAEG